MRRVAGQRDSAGNEGQLKVESRHEGLRVQL
jgi:hypothetical protein